MAGKLNLFNLGSLGVDLTRSPLHADDGSFQQLQNAIPDMRGKAGGVAKRDGLAAINGTTAGGSVMGVVDVPLPATRTHYVPNNISSTSGNAWVYSTDAFQNVSTILGSVGPDRYTLAVQAVTQFDGAAWGANWPRIGRASVTWKNKIVFANDRFSEASGYHGITVFDGSTFKETTRVPINPDVAAVSKGIIDMLAEGEYIYVAVWDVGTGGDFKGSVYQLNPVNGQWTKLGATFTTGFIPSALGWYQGRLWAGTWTNAATDAGRVYWIRPGVDSAWTLDHTTTAGQGGVMAITPFRGELYVAVLGSSTKAGLVLKRTTTGTWSTSQTGSETTDEQGYVSLVVFGSHLYASYSDLDAGASYIERYDGSSWATVSDHGTTYRHWMLWQDGTTLYAIDQNDNNADHLLVTTDGSTWAERGPAQLDPTSRNGFGVLFN